MTAPAGQTAPGPAEQLADGSLTGKWKLDPARSKVMLKSKSMWGLLPVTGVFRETEGQAAVSAAGEVSGHLTVRTASLDTKMAKRDEHLRSADFFSSDTYPAITFTAGRIEPDGQGVTVSGILTVRDQSRPLSFPATPSFSEGEVSVDATVQIDRSDFGLTFNRIKMSSMRNTVTIHAVFTREDDGR